MALGNGNGNGIWEVVSRFYRAKTTFNDFYDSHNCEGSVSAEDFENLVEEQMKPLRERSREVLKPTKDAKKDLGTDLFNIVLRELVHEVRDLSSAIRQTSYISKVDKYIADNELSEAEDKLATKLRDVLNDAPKRIPRKYQEVWDLFDQTTNVLEQNILPEYRDNTSLLQSMISHEDLFRCEDKSRLPDIFGYMFKDSDGSFEAYYIAGAKWLKSGHIENAITYLNVAFEQYDSRQEDRKFVKRSEDKIRASLNEINTIVDKGPNYLKTITGKKDRDLDEISMNLQELRNRLSGYLN
jgi:tetratricopeptide (TPR) repeat protein